MNRKNIESFVERYERENGYRNETGHLSAWWQDGEAVEYFYQTFTSAELRWASFGFDWIGSIEDKIQGGVAAMAWSRAMDTHIVANMDCPFEFESRDSLIGFMVELDRRSRWLATAAIK